MAEVEQALCGVNLPSALLGWKYSAAVPEWPMGYTSGCIKIPLPGLGQGDFSITAGVMAGRLRGAI